MALEINQIREILKSPRNQKVINKAIEHERRLKFHIETSLTREEASQACQNFLQYVKGILPRDKYRIFLAIFRFPVMTNEVTEIIHNSLEKIFDGRDPFFDYFFNSDSALQDWHDYKDDKLGGQEYWKTVAFEVMKVAINSFQIVDLKAEQESTKPEPYHYFKNIGSVHDFGVNEKGEVTDLLWVKETKVGSEKVCKLYVLDDETYRVFNMTEKREIGEEADIENAHPLGYCPARFFWSTKMRKDEPALKKSELTNQLSNLDDLLFSFYSKMHLDLYCAYPIYYGMEVDCDYKNPESGAKCENGFIKDRHNTYMINEYGMVEQCPVCSSKRQAGPGTFIETPYPEEGEDELKQAPIGILQVDKGSLEYNRDELKRKEEKLISNVIGFSGEMPDQAINRFQVGAMMESMKATILRVQRNFEMAQKWAEETICILRYGTVIFEGAAISYGTEHYFFTLEQLTEIYRLAKEAGAHESELDSLQDQIMETEHRNNPQALQRAKILSHIEPYRHMTRKELLEAMKVSSGLFNEEDVQVKINFSNLVSKFEREVTSIVDFGTSVDFSKKIDLIYQKLIEYVRDKENRAGDGKQNIPGQQTESGSEESEGGSDDGGSQEASGGEGES